MTLLSGWAAEVERSVLVQLWRFAFDQFDPCLGICVASALEMVVALRGEEAKEMLPTPFRVFEVADGI